MKRLFTTPLLVTEVALLVALPFVLLQTGNSATEVAAPNTDAIENTSGESQTAALLPEDREWLEGGSVQSQSQTGSSYDEYGASDGKEMLGGKEWLPFAGKEIIGYKEVLPPIGEFTEAINPGFRPLEPDPEFLPVNESDNNQDDGEPGVVNPPDMRAVSPPMVSPATP